MVLGIIILIIAVCFFLYFKTLDFRAKKEVYSEIGRKLNLSTSFSNNILGKFSLEGELNGYKFRISDFSFTKNDNTVRATKIIFKNPPQMWNFIISEENYLTRIGDNIGAGDIQIGDEKLDYKYEFKCSSIKYFKELFDDKTKIKLAEMSPYFRGSITKKGKRIVLEYNQPLNDPITIKPILIQISFIIYLMNRAKEIE
ncbi:MAG: hypothetical protein ABJG68_01460 [Crocinitomicaceae bacterium]